MLGRDDLTFFAGCCYECASGHVIGSSEEASGALMDGEYALVGEELVFYACDLQMVLEVAGQESVQSESELLCPSCGGKMSIISFIEEPKILDRIIAHLKLTFMAQRPPPQHIQQELLMAAEEQGEYF